MNKGIMVGMSGGVDSSVAAALLLEQGHQVTGVTLKLWEQEENGTETVKSCCSLDDVEDARRVAYRLGIPFYVMNMKEEFRQHVVEYFASAYQAGSTPNPCIACNQVIKFEIMLRKAEALGFKGIATGHYARNLRDPASGRFLLFKGLDPAKDQSYGLYMLNQYQLSRILFPLGGLEKTKAREIALEKGLVNARKAESQDICFIVGQPYGEFIEEITGTKALPGNILNSSGEIIGQHKGLIHYTVGQRKGLGLTVAEPVYVTKKDPVTNSLWVGSHKATYAAGLLARGMNYIPFDKPEGEFEAMVKVRYTAREVPAKVYPLEEGRARLEFFSPQPFVAPGQSVVLYQGELVLGGGIIEREIPVETC